MQHPLSEHLLPEKVRRAVSPLLPHNKRMAVASGLLPLSPQETVLCLYQLCFDEDQQIASKAKETLLSLPSELIASSVSQLKWENPLDFIAELFAKHSGIIASLLKNPNTSNETIARIARKCSKDIADTIATNQKRLMEYPQIIESLYYNKNTRMSTVDRVISFAVRNNIPLDGIPAYREIAATYCQQTQNQTAEPGGAEIEKSQTEQLDSLFEQTLFEGFEKDEVNFQEMEVTAEMMGAGGEATFSEFDSAGGEQAGIFSEFDSEVASGAGPGMFAEFDEFLSRDKQKKQQQQEQKEDEKLPLEVKISKMPVAQKIRLATIGSASHRSVLVQDPNKMVALAAIKSPAVSDQEVIRISQSRSVAEDVLRYIASNREWTKNYFLKVNLVNNPKTPLSSSMHFLSHLRKHDLKSVASNKNIPIALRTAATNMLKRMGAKLKH